MAAMYMASQEGQETSELEVVEFLLGKDFFGVQVLTVREVINWLPATPIPLSHSFMEGMIQVRGEILPLIDLAKCVGYSSSKRNAQDKIIIVEIHKQNVAFHVDEACRIHRFSRGRVEKTNKINQGLHGASPGVVQLENKLIILIDLEKLLLRLSL